MVSLHAFIDDSASDIGSRRLFLVGYIHGAEGWISFSAAWRDALARPPSLQYFKMAEAQSLRGQFRQWTQADRNRKLLSLAKVIQDHDPWAVHCSVSRDDYARILAPVAPYPLKNPYSMCFWGVIQTAAAYHRELGIEGTPPVDFVFDQQGGLGDDAALWYDWMKQQQEPEIRDLLGDRPIFCDDRHVVALQAADMLAWHVRRADEGGDLPVPEVADMIQGHGASREVTEEALVTMAKGMRRVPGVSSIQTKREWRETRVVTKAAVDAGVGPPDTRWSRLYWLSVKVRARAVAGRWRRFRKRLLRRPR
jgi:hypothetical protein